MTPATILALRTAIAAAYHAGRYAEAHRLQAFLHAFYLADH